MTKIGQKLNIKNNHTKLQKIRTYNEDITITDTFYLLGSTDNNKRPSTQEICDTLAQGRIATKALEKMSKCHDVFMPAKIKIVHAMVFPVKHYRRKV